MIKIKLCFYNAASSSKVFKIRVKIAPFEANKPTPQKKKNSVIWRKLEWGLWFACFADLRTEIVRTHPGTRRTASTEDGRWRQPNHISVRTAAERNDIVASSSPHQSSRITQCPYFTSLKHKILRSTLNNNKNNNKKNHNNDNKYDFITRNSKRDLLPLNKCGALICATNKPPPLT